MRRLFTVLALVIVAQTSAGCKHTAGVCDCGQSPGDSVPISSSHKPVYSPTPVYTQIGAPLPPQTMEPISVPH